MAAAPRGCCCCCSAYIRGARARLEEEEEDEDEDEDGDGDGEEGSGGAAAYRGPRAARDLLPEEAGRDGEEGGGAPRALRRTHRPPPPPPLRRARHKTLWNVMRIFWQHKKGVHGSRILEKSKSKDFQVPKETIDKRPNNDDMRSIDEIDISTLNMDQLSQIERLLEDELRWTRARKLEANRIARLQKKVQRKAAIVESSSKSKEIPTEQDKKQAEGNQQSAEEVKVVLSNGLRLGIGRRGGGASEQRHRTPFDLNMPCRDAGPLQ